MSTPSAQVFDEWYEAIAASPVWDEFVGEALHLPDGVQSTGYLSGPGLLEVVQRLALRRGEMLVELGCGRAGYGLAAIRESGAHLIGVDFAPAALRAAQAAAKRFGVADRAEFRAADLAVTGLSADVADALLCVDAFHFGSSPAAAALECRRVLRPGGRLVITTWARRGSSFLWLEHSSGCSCSHEHPAEPALLFSILEGRSRLEALDIARLFD